KTVGWNPVCALGKNRPSINDKLKGLTGNVGMAVQRDRSQADAAQPASDAATVGMEDLNLERVERLRTVPVGPPELGVLHANFCSGAFGDHNAVQRQSVVTRDPCFPMRQFRNNPEGDTAIRAMQLGETNAFEPVFAPCFQ